jgi:hypothetical protein
MGRPCGGSPHPSAALAAAVVEDAAAAPLIHGAGRADQVDDLPEAYLAQAITLTSPCSAIIYATVSPTFRAAADSDHLWHRFQPVDLLLLHPSQHQTRSNLPMWIPQNCK